MKTKFNNGDVVYLADGIEAYYTSKTPDGHLVEVVIYGDSEEYCK